jgi:thiol-disulfide isomerase/thioredoxin
MSPMTPSHAAVIEHWKSPISAFSNIVKITSGESITPLLISSNHNSINIFTSLDKETDISHVLTHTSSTTHKKTMSEVLELLGFSVESAKKLISQSNEKTVIIYISYYSPNCEPCVKRKSSLNLLGDEYFVINYEINATTTRLVNKVANR